MPGELCWVQNAHAEADLPTRLCQVQPMRLALAQVPLALYHSSFALGYLFVGQAQEHAEFNNRIHLTTKGARAVP